MKHHLLIAFLATVVSVAQEATIRVTPDFAAVIHAATQTAAQLVSGPETVSLSLPYRGPYIECWYIIFRDVENKPARFTVQVNKLGTTAGNMPARTSATATN